MAAADEIPEGGKERDVSIAGPEGRRRRRRTLMRSPSLKIARMLSSSSAVLRLCSRVTQGEGVVESEKDGRRDSAPGVHEGRLACMPPGRFTADSIS